MMRAIPSRAGAPAERLTSATRRQVLISLLHECRLLSGLPPEDRARIVDTGAARSARKGECFFQEGGPASEICVVVRGMVKLRASTPRGRDVILTVARRGDPIGHVAALAGRPYLGSAEALDESEVLAFDPRFVWQAFARRPEAGLGALRFLAGQCVDAWRRQTTARERVEARVARAVLTLLAVHDGTAAEMTQTRVAHRDVAALAGTTAYTVSRIMSRWEKAQLIIVRRCRLIVCRPEAIAALAGVGPDSKLTASN